MDIRNFIINPTETDNDSIINIYFSLDWTGKYPNYNKMWTLKKPEKNYSYQKITKIKHNNKIILLHLLGNLFSDKDNKSGKVFDDLNELPKNIDFVEFSNSSMLKSIIQKSIRRKNSKLAILASFHLMRLNLNEFLRRIIVISIEDTCFHQSLSVLLWFMMTNDSKLICKNYIRYFLGIVYYLSNSNNYDRMITNKSSKLNIKHLFDYQDYQKNILISIWIRSKYGGMKGDISMINNILIHWNNYILNENIKYRLIDKIKYIKINQYLNLDSISLYSVDFHCYPNVIKKIHKRYPELTLEIIKEKIWNNNSKINFRNKISYPKDSTWNKIRKYYYTLIKNFIYTYY